MASHRASREALNQLQWRDRTGLSPVSLFSFFSHLGRLFSCLVRLGYAGRSESVAVFPAKFNHSQPPPVRPELVEGPPRVFRGGRTAPRTARPPRTPIVTSIAAVSF